MVAPLFVVLVAVAALALLAVLALVVIALVRRDSSGAGRGPVDHDLRARDHARAIEHGRRPGPSDTPPGVGFL